MYFHASKILLIYSCHSFSFFSFKNSELLKSIKNHRKTEKCKLNFVRFLKSRSTEEKYSCL